MVHRERYLSLSRGPDPSLCDDADHANDARERPQRQESFADGPGAASRAGQSYDSWAKLLLLLANELASMNEVRGFTSAGTGWGLRVRQKGARDSLHAAPAQPVPRLICAW